MPGRADRGPRDRRSPGSARTLVAESSGDRFQDALKKVRLDRDQAEAKFRQAQSEEKTKAQALDQLFQKSLEQAKKDDPAKPPTKDIDWE
jgi:hypothetical protein